MVLQLHPRGQLFVVSAPSGGGKSTLCEALLKSDLNLRYSVSTTTRPRRSGEIEGISYSFVTNDVFDQLVKEDAFAEYAEVHGNRYGTPKSFLDDLMDGGEDVILDVDVQGARSLRKAYPDGIFIFIYPPSVNELERRLRERKTDSSEEIERRIQRAYEEMNEIRHYDYVVMNDDFTRALERLRAIVIAERCRSDRFNPTRG